MICDQQEKFKELISFISTHTIDRSISGADQKAIEESFEWNASLFFAKVIHLAEPREKKLGLVKLFIKVLYLTLIFYPIIVSILITDYFELIFYLFAKIYGKLLIPVNSRLKRTHFNRKKITIGYK